MRKVKLNIQLLNGSCQEIGAIEHDLKLKGHITEREVKDRIGDKDLKGYLFADQKDYSAALTSKLYEMTLDIGKTRFRSKFFRISFVYDTRADKAWLFTNGSGLNELRQKTPQEFFQLFKPVEIDKNKPVEKEEAIEQA